MKAKIRHNRRLFTHFCLLMLAGIGLLLAGCDSPAPSPAHSDNEFTTMEVKNKIAHFSFEYRNYYHEIDGPWVDDNEYRKITYVDILASKQSMSELNPEPEKSGETVSMQYTPAYIGIMVSNAFNRPFRPASERISKSLSSWSRWQHFKLLERKNIMISGTQGEMASYEVDGLIGPKLLYQSDVAFDYNGQEWNINLIADVALTDMVKTDFQHVIETFKILD